MDDATRRRTDSVTSQHFLNRGAELLVVGERHGVSLDLLSGSWPIYLDRHAEAALLAVLQSRLRPNHLPEGDAR